MALDNFVLSDGSLLFRQVLWSLNTLATNNLTFPG